MGAGLPAICGNSGHRYEDATLPIDDGYRVTSVAIPASPCPQCGSPGGIIDGAYDIRGGRAVARWPASPIAAGGGWPV